jgi:predicted transposase YdaD
LDVLIGELEQRRPEHPLVAVFKPLLVDDEAALAASAVRYYQQIKSSGLDEPATEALSEVFVNWMEQRFRNKSKQEIEAMFVGELPELEETQSGKDLIAIGERRGVERGKREGKREGKKEGKEEGRKEGKIESILVYLEAKHETLPQDLRQAISELSSAKASRLLAHLPRCETLGDVEAWLEANA